MSTLLYAALTVQRQKEEPPKPAGAGGGGSPPTKLTDAVAALVPAEVIAVAAAISSLTVTSSTDERGDAQKVISSPGVAEWSFYALLVVSVLLYVIPKYSTFTRVDWIRAAIPPLAFACWTMLQTNTAIDVLLQTSQVFLQRRQP